jgi:hypothetical protein
VGPNGVITDGSGPVTVEQSVRNSPRPLSADWNRRFTDVPDDLTRAIAACHGDPACERALGTVFQQIDSTPLQPRYRQTPNKCHKWVDDFLKLNYPGFSRTSQPDGKISLGGGSLTLEPLEVMTRGQALLVTSRNVFDNVTGAMSEHAIVRVGFNPKNGQTSVGYFDLGSSTSLGNYGGADHWFFDDAEGLQLEMDFSTARPFFEYLP